MEAAFIRGVAATGDPVYAATKAGYAHPHQAAQKNMAKPAIDAAIRAATTADLHNDLRPKALRHLHNVLDDPKAPIRDKTMVAKIVLDKTDAPDALAAGKEPHEMTAIELDRARDLLMRELAARARPVIEAEPVKVEAPSVEAEPGVFD
jgi:phage terminase small subunit